MRSLIFGEMGPMPYIAIAALDLAPKPRTLEFTQAAAVLLSVLTAGQALFDYGRLAAGTKAAKRSAKAACESRCLKCQPSTGSSPTACPRLPEFRGPDYFAFFFSASIRSLAAGPDEAGFWPVISWPSATV
jgi:hypothetical protein